MEKDRPHSCAVCRGEARQVPGTRRCKVVFLLSQATRNVEAELRSRRLWCGRRALHALERRYLHLSSVLARNGGVTDPRWPLWLHDLASEIVDARASEHGAATIRRIKKALARRKKPQE